MPQVIDLDIFVQAYRFFDFARYGYMICDWSMYFNFALHHYPNESS